MQLAIVLVHCGAVCLSGAGGHCVVEQLVTALVGVHAQLVAPFSRVELLVVRSGDQTRVCVGQVALAFLVKA